MQWIPHSLILGLFSVLSSAAPTVHSFAWQNPETLLNIFRNDERVDPISGISTRFAILAEIAERERAGTLGSGNPRKRFQLLEVVYEGLRTGTPGPDHAFHLGGVQLSLHILGNTVNWDTVEIEGEGDFAQFVSDFRSLRRLTDEKLKASLIWPGEVSRSLLEALFLDHYFRRNAELNKKRFEFLKRHIPTSGGISRVWPLFLHYFAVEDLKMFSGVENLGGETPQVRAAAWNTLEVGVILLKKDQALKESKLRLALDTVMNLQTQENERQAAIGFLRQYRRQKVSKETDEIYCEFLRGAIVPQQIPWLFEILEATHSSTIIPALLNRFRGERDLFLVLEVCLALCRYWLKHEYVIQPSHLNLFVNAVHSLEGLENEKIEALEETLLLLAFVDPQKVKLVAMNRSDAYLQTCFSRGAEGIVAGGLSRAVWLFALRVAGLDICTLRVLQDGIRQ